MRKTMMAALLALACAAPAAVGAVDLENYIRQETFQDIKISPGGDYYAATVPLEDSTAVVIMRTSDNTPMGTFRPPRNNHATNFDWVSNERVLIELSEKFGSLDTPQRTGELYAINANGGRGELLVGYRVEGNGPGTRIQPKKVEAVAAFLTDELANDDRNVLVAVWPFGNDPFTRVERLDVTTGRRVQVAGSPVRNASFTTDNKGDVRFAHGSGTDNVNKLYYRQPSNNQWVMVNDEAVNNRIETAIGFAEDNSVAYLQVQQPKGPDAIVSWNPETGERKTLLADDVVDPYRIIFRNGTRVPVGALYLGDTTRSRFFDETSADARLYHSLEAAFKQPVYITSSTRDGKKVLVETWTGNDPGSFYVFDTVAKSAQHLISRSEWLDVDKTAPVRAVSLKARDGLPLHGFLTLPHGSDGRNLPMVVLPHGGPYDIFDSGRYDMESQLLADAGYAVLQVNFRGSGNYGRAHTQAGARQWGGTMQDDVTDATRWAVAQGIANKDRICIYGASYGAYSAMMGAAREPGMYKCAAGYVGVYDLPMMFTRGDIQNRGSGMTYLRDWLGDPAKLGTVSPVTLAGQIKVPVFLAAGGEDKRAPIEHTKRLEAALKKAGTPVESLYYSTEGHGFYRPEHEREYYSRLLAFLSNSLGGAKASAAAPKASGKAP